MLDGTEFFYRISIALVLLLQTELLKADYEEFIKVRISFVFCYIDYHLSLREAIVVEFGDYREIAAFNSCKCFFSYGHESGGEVA